MGDVLEKALSGRARCRGCKKKLEKDVLRFGEAVPNTFGDGESTHWFCLYCGAEKRAEKFQPLLLASELELPDRDGLNEAARLGIEHPKLAEIAHAERSPTGRARCRQCREMIEKDALRLALERSDDGMVSSSGFVHVSCAAAFFGTTNGILTRLRRTSAELAEQDFEELEKQLASQRI
jgi:hypothetical protein